MKAILLRMGDHLMFNVKIIIDQLLKAIKILFFYKCCFLKYNR